MKNLEEENQESESTAKSKNRSQDYETFVATGNRGEMAKTPSKKDKKSRSAKSAWSIFAPMEVVSSADMKLRKWGIMNRTIKQIIIVGTLDGKMKIFHSEIIL